jgi:hypothetical protein
MGFFASGSSPDVVVGVVAVVVVVVAYEEEVCAVDVVVVRKCGAFNEPGMKEGARELGDADGKDDGAVDGGGVNNRF